MPIYEYICQDCKKEFELIRPMGQADAPTVCTACGGQNTRRKLALVMAMSGGKTVAGTSGGAACGSCAGGHCSSCGH